MFKRLLKRYWVLSRRQRVNAVDVYLDVSENGFCELIAGDETFAVNRFDLE